MRDWVSEWVQDGQVFVWRYKSTSRHYRGWHFTGDPAGCSSIRNLIDRMSGGEACHRTLKLEPVPRTVWEVPNFGEARNDNFTALRVQFEPDLETLAMTADDERLIMSFGNRHVAALRAAFTEVEIGHGDFGLGTSDKRGSALLMFWWMPRSVSNGKEKR